MSVAILVVDDSPMSRTCLGRTAYPPAPIDPRASAKVAFGALWKAFHSAPYG
jgi:hypothetical protein